MRLDRLAQRADGFVRIAIGVQIADIEVQRRVRETDIQGAHHFVAGAGFLAVSLILDGLAEMQQHFALGALIEGQIAGAARQGVDPAPVGRIARRADDIFRLIEEQAGQLHQGALARFGDGVELRLGVRIIRRL